MLGSGKQNRILVILMIASLAVMASACARILRTKPPVEGTPLGQPWGSVPLQASAGQIQLSISDNFIKSLRDKLIGSSPGLGRPDSIKH
jgi:hypothetical protein